LSLGTTARVWSIVTDSCGRQLGMVSTPLEGADIGPPSPERVVGGASVILWARVEWAQGAHDVENPGGDRHCRP